MQVPTIAHTRVPVTVPPPRVPAEVTPPRVMSPRKLMITQEDPIGYIRRRDTVELTNKNLLKHRYHTRITQLSQEINQVERATPAVTRHQQWMMNIHEQVKITPQVIDNCLNDNAFKIPQKITHQNYQTND